jgi:hypothetical protein
LVTAAYIGATEPSVNNIVCVPKGYFVVYDCIFVSQGATDSVAFRRLAAPGKYSSLVQGFQEGLRRERKAVAEAALKAGRRAPQLNVMQRTAALQFALNYIEGKNSEGNRAWNKQRNLV